VEYIVLLLIPSIASKFGVHYMTISDIKLEKTWKHIKLETNE